LLVKIHILSDLDSKGFQEAEDRSKMLGAAVAEVGSRLKTLGLSATFAGTLAVNEFAKFDTGVREIGTLLDGVTDNVLSAMRNELSAMSIQFGQAIDKMTKARYDVVSAGFTDASDSAILLSESAKLATAGVSEVSKTADVLTSVLNAYQLEADQSAKISDILFTTVRLGKTTIDQLTSSLGTAAAIAPALGVDFETLSAAVATLTAQGLSTDEVITALQATMTAMLKPSVDMQNALEETGFATGKAAIEALGFDGAIQKLTEGISDTEIAARFPNVRAMRAVFPLVGDAAEKFADNIEQIKMSTGATDEAFEKMTESVSFKINQLRESWRKVMINIGQALLPVVDGLANLSNAFINLTDSQQLTVLSMGGLLVSLRAFMPLIRALSQIMKPNIIAFGAFVKSIDIFTTATTPLGKAFTSLVFHFKALGAVVSSLFASMGPTGWLILGFGALTTAAFALGDALEDPENNLADFRRSLDSFTTSTATSETKKLEAELQDLSTQYEKLVKKVSEEFELNVSNQGAIFGTETQEELNKVEDRIELVSGKLQLLRATKFKKDFEDAGVVIEKVATSLDPLTRAKEELETIGPVIKQLTTRIESLKTEISSTRTEFGSIRFAATISDLSEELETATQRQNILNQTIRQLESKPIEKAAEELKQVTEAKNRLSEDRELLLSVKVENKDLIPKLESTVEQLRNRKLSLVVQAQLQLATDGEIEEKLKEDLSKIGQSISAAQGALAQSIAIEAPKIQLEFESAQLDQAKLDVKDFYDELDELNEESSERDVANLIKTIDEKQQRRKDSIESLRTFTTDAFKSQEQLQIDSLSRQFDDATRHMVSLETLQQQYNDTFSRFQETQNESYIRSLEDRASILSQQLATDETLQTDSNTRKAEIELEYSELLNEIQQLRSETTVNNLQGELEVLRSQIEERLMAESNFAEMVNQINQESLSRKVALKKQELSQNNALFVSMEAANRTFWANVLRTDVTGSEKRVAIIQSIERAFLSYLANTLKEFILTIAAEKGIAAAAQTAATAQAAVTGSAIASSYTAAATFASIATLGGAAAAGSSSVLAALAAVRGAAAIGLNQGGIIENDTGKLNPGEKIVAFIPKGEDKLPFMLAMGEAVIPAASVENNREIIERLISDSSKISSSEVKNIQQESNNSSEDSEFEKVGATISLSGFAYSGTIASATNNLQYANTGAIAGDSFTTVSYAKHGKVVGASSIDVRYANQGAIVGRVDSPSYASVGTVVNSRVNSPSYASMGSVVGFRTSSNVDSPSYASVGTITNRINTPYYASKGGVFGDSIQMSTYANMGAVATRINTPYYAYIGGISGDRIQAPSYASSGMFVNGSRIQSATFAQGGAIVGGNSSFVSGPNIRDFVSNSQVDQQNRETKVVFNISINSQSLDPAGAVEALNDFVRSPEFIEPFVSAVNDRNIVLEVNDQAVDAR